MPLRPKHRLVAGRPSAERQFTDREDFLRSFQGALAGNQPDKHQVLVFYGVGGIGKTSLRRELHRLVDNRPDVVAAALDFDVAACRDQDTALFALRREFQSRHKAGFPTFDVAYAAYWQKTRPQLPMTSETLSLLNDGIVLSDILTLGGAVPFIGVIPRLPFLVLRGKEILRDWWTRRGHEELRGLAGMEALDIASRLPMFWAADLRDFLSQKHRTAVFFLDTYDALAEAERVEGKLRERDAWLRELIAQLPEALWVICGRERLRWEEADKEWSGCLEQHLVGGLAEEDARQFLISCGISGPAIQQVIVESSQGVPYFLDLAVDTWLEIRDRQEREPAAEDFAHTRLEMFDRFLKHLTYPEVETLKVLSTPRFWDYALFETLMARFQTGFPTTAFAELCRFSFISESTPAGTYTMHQLMRQSLQEHQAQELRTQVHRFLFDHYRNRLGGLEPRSVSEPEQNALTEAFYHGRAALAADELFDWFRGRAQVFAQAAQWKFLTPMSEEVSELLERTLGPEDPRVATALSDLALLYSSQGRYADAEPLHRRALAIREQALGPDHVDVAATLKNLAVLSTSQGRYPEAEPLFRRALAISEAALGPDHPEVAQIVNHLADLYREQSRYAEAEPLYRRVMAIRERVLGPGNLQVAESLNSLAVLFWNQGRYAEAEPHFRRALQIREAALGPDHPDVAEAMNNLAVLDWQLGRYAEAEPLHKRALAVREKALGPDHPDVAESASNLGLLYWSQGEYAKAEPLYKQALEVKEETLGPDHPNLAIYLNNLAVLYWKTGRFSEAEPLFRQTLGILEKTLGPEHPNVAKAINNLARLYNSQGRLEEADPLIVRAVAIEEKVLGPNHTDLGRSLNTLANLRRDQGRTEEAESAYRRSLAILEKALGPDHSDVANVLEDLAKFYAKTGRAAEAEAIRQRLRSR